MYTAYAKVIEMLEESAEQLKNELKPLEFEMISSNDGIFITYDDNTSNPTLIVYSPNKYRAYIPKKYDGWAVKFIEWNGEDIQLAADQIISFGG